MNTGHDFDLVAFGAHPDDVELFAGGTLAKSVAQGMRVAIVDLTRGELGTRGTAETRKAEAAAAQAILGVEHRENLDLGDGFFEVNEETLRAAIEVLRRLRPLRVIANALSDRHPDHGRGAELIHRAAFLSGLPKIDTGQEAWRPQAVYHGIQDHWLNPDFVVDIEGYGDVKAQAIAAYATQFHQPGADDVEPTTPISTRIPATPQGPRRRHGAVCWIEAGRGLSGQAAVGCGWAGSLGVITAHIATRR